jgi:hypothetical protein
MRLTFERRFEGRWRVLRYGRRSIWSYPLHRPRSSVEHEPRCRCCVGWPPACRPRAGTPSATRECWPRQVHGDVASRREHLPRHPRTARGPASRSALPPTDPGRNSWPAPSTTVSTASHTREVTGPVRVTHPFHPRHGQELDVLAHRVQWGEGRVFYRDPQGHRASMPVGWTSLAAQDPYLAVGAARSRFRLPDLIDLAALLAGVRR